MVTVFAIHMQKMDAERWMHVVGELWNEAAAAVLVTMAALTLRLREE